MLLFVLVTILRILLTLLGLVFRALFVLLTSNAPPTAFHGSGPPRGLGLPWLPDRSYRAYADFQRPGTTFDAW